MSVTVVVLFTLPMQMTSQDLLGLGGGAILMPQPSGGGLNHQRQPLMEADSVLQPHTNSMSPSQQQAKQQQQQPEKVHKLS